MEIDEKAVDQVQNIIKKLLNTIGIEGTIKTKIVENQGKEAVWVNINTPEANILIGQNGTSLLAFQHLARVMLRRKMGKIINFVVDVNDYKRKKEGYLKDLAFDSASRVKESGEEIVLKPMPAYERRIIHLALAESKEVTTESIGQEPKRRVVIKPKSKIPDYIEDSRQSRNKKQKSKTQT